MKCRWYAIDMEININDMQMKLNGSRWLANYMKHENIKMNEWILNEEIRWKNVIQLICKWY